MDMMAYAAANALTAPETARIDFYDHTTYDLSVIFMPFCSDLSFAGIGWVGLPGTLQNSPFDDYDASVAHELVGVLSLLVALGWSHRTNSARTRTCVSIAYDLWRGVVGPSTIFKCIFFFFFSTCFVNGNTIISQGHNLGANHASVILTGARGANAFGNVYSLSEQSNWVTPLWLLAF
jgi:hypothetical protein